MRWRFAAVSLAATAVALVVLASPASADVRRGSLAYRSGAERPRLEYRVFWGVVDDDTVRTTRVMVRAVNPQYPGSARNWASVTVFVGGVHPGVGGSPWDGHAAWSTISPSRGTTSAAGEAGALKRAGAEVVWSCRLFLGSGVWKTRYVPIDRRRSARYETWVRVRFHATGRTQYWFRMTPPLG